MKNVPKIVSVTPKEDMTLKVLFDGGEEKKIDIKPYLSLFQSFKELENPALFRSVKVDVGGMGIIWNDKIDLSRYDIWEYGF